MSMRDIMKNKHKGTRMKSAVEKTKKRKKAADKQKRKNERKARKKRQKQQKQQKSQKESLAQKLIKSGISAGIVDSDSDDARCAACGRDVPPLARAALFARQAAWGPRQAAAAVVGAALALAAPKKLLIEVCFDMALRTNFEPARRSAVVNRSTYRVPALEMRRRAC